MRASIPAAYVPLFDRFDSPPSEPLGPGLLDAAGLQDSLARDLHRLLSTKCHLTIQAYLDSDALTVLDYGIPDLSGLAVHSSEQLATAAAVITKSLAVFEPRLRMVEISCSPYPGSNTRMLIEISGAVMLAGRLHRVGFEMSGASDQTMSLTSV